MQLICDLCDLSFRVFQSPAAAPPTSNGNGNGQLGNWEGKKTAGGFLLRS